MKGYLTISSRRIRVFVIMFILLATIELRTALWFNGFLPGIPESSHKASMILELRIPRSESSGLYSRNFSNSWTVFDFSNELSSCYDYNSSKNFFAKAGKWRG